MRPRRSYNREVAVASAVAELRDRFDYPDEAQRGIPAVGDEGGGAPTIFVAASDASDFSKQKADLIATGSSDEETIQFAVDQLGATGGRVLLSEGTFDITMAGSSFQVVRVGTDVVIQGMGMDATVLNISDEPEFTFDPVIFGEDVDGRHLTVRDLTIQGGVGTNEAVGVYGAGGLDHLLVENVRFDTTGFGVVGQFMGRTIVRDCRFDGEHGVYAGSSSDELVVSGCRFVTTGDCIQGTSGTETYINDCYFDSGASAITGAFGSLTVLGNEFVRTALYGINVSVGETRIIGNFFGLASTTSVGIRIVDATPDLATGDTQIISGNRIQGPQVGIHVVGHRGEVMIADNSVQNTIQHGIIVEDCDHAQVHHNLLHRNGNGSFNTYDAIRIVDSDRTKVDHNKVIVPWLTGTGSTRYGVHVVSGSCNIVVGNDLGIPSGYGQDALGDFGTDTMLYYPAAGFYGDNFTDCPPGS